jgi:hypothetical protein
MLFPSSGPFAASPMFRKPDGGDADLRDCRGEFFGKVVFFLLFSVFFFFFRALEEKIIMRII